MESDAVNGGAVHDERAGRQKLYKNIAKHEVIEKRGAAYRLRVAI